MSHHDVVPGLDLCAPDDHVLAFAFGAAVRRDTRSRVVHGWRRRTSHEPADVLRPWQDKWAPRARAPVAHGVLQPAVAPVAVVPPD
ncbi:hypothetical protein [Streptomyces sp. NBC_01314]|uniref:hypothetical protein n=1 Tax=Streptomyces sp. NBC_01314 TaxID=2903821 RepID=UPI0030915EC2|nr:hypothetical protein OG622_42575 [Streptomyces sp. NBC_01314]